VPFDLGIDGLRTLTFVLLVFGSQATLYAIRNRRTMWGTRPSLWLIVSSVGDVLIAVILGVGGIAMTPISAEVAACALGAAIVFSVALNALKIPICRRLNIA
jgi:H+-transporting ATPase